MQNYLDMWARTPHTFGDQKSSTCGHSVKFKETEKTEIQKDGEWICIRRPIVAIATEELSSDHSFSMILPEEYVR